MCVCVCLYVYMYCVFACVCIHTISVYISGIYTDIYTHIYNLNIRIIFHRNVGEFRLDDVYIK